MRDRSAPPAIRAVRGPLVHMRLGYRTWWRARGPASFRTDRRPPPPWPILTSPSAEPTETAAEIDGPESFHIGQHNSQRDPFDRAVQTFDGTAEFAVAVEEIRPVVDVLRHACAFRSPTSRRIPSFQDRPATASRHPTAQRLS